MSHPYVLPPLRPIYDYRMRDGMKYDLYICCEEEDINNVSNCIKRLRLFGCKCVEFFKDGAAYLPVLKEMENFLLRSRWIGLYITDGFLKSSGTRFQIDAFVHHVINIDKKKRIILLITNEPVAKRIPAILQPFDKVHMFSDDCIDVLSNIIKKKPKSLTTGDITKFCGNSDHMDIDKMVPREVASKAYTVNGPFSENIIPRHKYRDAKISNMAQHRPFQVELLSDVKGTRKQKVQSASSTRSAVSFASGVSSEDSGLPDDLLDESADEMDDLARSYKDVLELQSSESD